MMELISFNLNQNRSEGNSRLTWTEDLHNHSPSEEEEGSFLYLCQSKTDASLFSLETMIRGVLLILMHGSHRTLEPGCVGKAG